MAVSREAYSLERYLVAGAIIENHGRRRLSAADVNMRSGLSNGLDPEIEVLDDMDILDSYYSPVEGERKHMVSDEYAGDFAKVNGYFNAAYFPADYQKNWRLVIQEFDEVDREKLEGEVDVVDLLS